MEEQKREKLKPRKVFRKRGTCSQAMFHLLNHEFGNQRTEEEKAADMLAGGIAQKGHQCGMLWGAALAVGTEAYKRFDDKDEAIARSIDATRGLLRSFYNRTKAVDCSDITRVDWSNKYDLILYTLKTLSRGLIYSPCFNLIVKWTPEAVEASRQSLDEHSQYQSPCLSCATEVVRKMGGSQEEAIMVAGFAGGIGLSGNACGALAAAIWYRMLVWGRENPGTEAAMFNNSEAKKLWEAFLGHTNSEVLCSEISEQEFDSIDAHSLFIKNGGCGELINLLASG